MCGPWVLEYWLISWASFWSTQHILIHHHYLQHWPLTWRHLRGRHLIWVSWMDRPFPVHGLNLFYRSWWPLVWRCKIRRPWWSYGLCGRRRFYPLKRVKPLRRCGWGGLNSGGSWATLQRIGAASLASEIFRFALVVNLGAVWVPRPPPRWRSASRALVLTYFWGTTIRTISAGCLAWTCLGPKSFQYRPVRTSLSDHKAYGSVPRGPLYLGVISDMAFCHGIFFRYFRNTISFGTSNS